MILRFCRNQDFSVTMYGITVPVMPNMTAAMDMRPALLPEPAYNIVTR